MFGLVNWFFLKTADDATCKQYCSTDVDIPSSCPVNNFKEEHFLIHPNFRAILSAVGGASAGLRAVFVQSSISVKWGIGCLGVGRARTGEDG